MAGFAVTPEGMKSFADAVREVLVNEGPLSLEVLARKALKRKPLAGLLHDRRNGAVRRILDMATEAKSDVLVVEEPCYHLGRSKQLEALPLGRRLRAVLLALSEAKDPLSLGALIRAYDDRYGDVSSNPIYEMYSHLEEVLSEPPWRIRRKGSLRIGLREMKEIASNKVRHTNRVESSPHSISRRLDEKSLESILESRLELLENGLTLIKRQFAIKGVGRIDLLCRDRLKNIVVIEIKRPSASHREVVGQITSYMGWVRRHMAGSGQSVRGIIVIGQADQRLAYSLESVQNVIVKTFY